MTPDRDDDAPDDPLDDGPDDARDEGPEGASKDVTFEAMLRAVASAPPIDPATLLGDLSQGDGVEVVVGGTVGPFRIVDRLGAGGMGVVFKAIDERLSRSVALKVIGTQAGLAGTFSTHPDPPQLRRRTRLLREARSAAAVTHPNLAAIYEVGEAGGVSYIAMEYVAGTTLRMRMHDGRLPIDEALAIARGISRGLGRAHREGIVHRDLKPDNVMLAEGPFDDIADAVKILDFGIAQPVDEPVDPSSPYASVAGTPAYMAPEQRVGATADARADVFAFGVVLFEMLTGQRPIDTRGRPTGQRLRALRPDTTSALVALVERCLAPQPRDRFANGAEVEGALRDLFALRTSDPAMASRPSNAPFTAFAIGGAAILVALFALSRTPARPTETTALLPPPTTNASATIAAATTIATPLRRLTANVPQNAIAHAAIAPDGATLAYIDKQGLWLLPTGAAVGRHIALPAGTRGELVAWTPQGDALLVTTVRNGAPSRELWALDLHAHAEPAAPPRRLAEANFSDIAVSSDGTRIAYAASDRIGWMPFSAGRTDVASDLHVLVTRSDGCFLSEVAWAPDDARIAFESLCFDSLASTAIETVDLRGGAPVVALADPRLFNADARGGLVWQPNGDLLFALAEWLPAEAGSNLWSVPVDTSSGHVAVAPKQRTHWIGTSASALSRDAKGGKIAFLRFETQADVYVGDLADHDRRLEHPRRLTLTDRDERPAAWTADGRDLLFDSDRSGNYDVFLQRISEWGADSGAEPGGLATTPARAIVATGDWETMPQLTPDGASILYWRFPAVAAGQAVHPDLYRAPFSTESPVDESKSVRLLRANGASHPAGAGRPQPWEMRVRCPRLRTARCVLSEKDEAGDLVFTAIDVDKGRLEVVLRLPHPTAASNIWDLSPDGTSIAVPTINGPVDVWTIGAAVLPTHPTESLDVVAGCDPLTASWNASGHGLFVTVECEADDRFSLYFRDISMPSKSARLLWDDTPNFILETVASPDDKHLAIALKAFDNDVWMVEGI